MNLPPLPPVAEIVDVVLRIALPAAVPAVAVPWWCARRFGSRSLDAGLLAGAVLGLAAANFLRGALPWLPVGRAWGWSWFLFVWAAALLAGAVGAGRTTRRKRIGASSLLAAAATGWVLLPAEFRPAGWPFAALVAAAWLPWFGALVATVLPDPAPTPRLPDLLILMTLALAGGSMVLIHAHSARLMDVALIAAFATAGGAVAAGWHGREGRVLWGLPCLTLPGLMLAGWHETSSDVPRESFLLAGFCLWPFLAFQGPAPSPNVRWLRAGLVLAPVALAVALAMRAETLEF